MATCTCLGPSPNPRSGACASGCGAGSSTAARGATRPVDLVASGGDRSAGPAQADADPQDSPVLVAALDDLMGAGGWKVRHDWGQVLVTFPGVAARSSCARPSTRAI